MIPPRRLTEAVWTSGSVGLADIGPLAEAGFQVLVNNRPDGEGFGQPTSAEVEAAATAQGLAYLYAPISGFPGAGVVAQIGEVLSGDRKTLLFCKSGMRSAVAWALATRQSGAMDLDAIVDAGREAGCDLSGLPL
ncbi:TIGR01244 family sulfur transferase [soil metagenome]